MQPFEEYASLWDGRVQLAVELAKQAGNLTRDHYFQTDAYQTERKRDNSPVTTADKEAEQLIRRILGDRFPQDGILGEEFGTSQGESSYEWIIDPIDGTKSFITGVPLYSTLVGLTHHGKSVAGVIYIPCLEELVFAAIGYGAWYQKGEAPWKKAHVSKVADLREGVFLVSQVDNFAKRGAFESYLDLESKAYITRSWGDGYGYLLVATGRAEVMVDPIVSPWDVAAIQPIMEEAGGRCSSWKGEFTIHGGDCVGSNGLVHASVLESLNRLCS